MSSAADRVQPRRRGVVAVAIRDERFLVIRRSESVVAPGAYCFPGGGIDDGEMEHEALVRELQEELAVAVRPLRRVWGSVTSWNVELSWWLVELPTPDCITPNHEEVASVHWMTTDEMRRLDNLLESNHQFLDAVFRREIDLDG